MASPDDPTVSSRYASRELNKLCDRCQTLFPTEGPWPWEREEFRIPILRNRWQLPHPSIPDLYDKAEAGCHLCRVFLDSLLPLEMIVDNRHGYQAWCDGNERSWGTYAISRIPASKSNSAGYVVELFYYTNETSKKYGISMDDTTHKRRYLQLQPVRPLNIEEDDRRTIWIANLGDTLTDPSLPDSLCAIFQPQSTTTFSASSFAQVRKWLTKCLDCHNECSKWKSIVGEKYDYLRKIRFVDVGTEERPNFRLVNGDTLVSGSGDIKYITLSYRWTAETENVKMKSDKKKYYEDAIPPDTLPQVYKDTATVARTLGVRYVWIDSLCIIQDSLEDWNGQSSIMDQIYTNGFLNISAMFADHAFGLRTERDRLSVSPCILSRCLPPDPVNGEERYEYWACFENYGTNSFVDLAPLFKRAWCHQERLLAIRNLYFGEQLIWQCQSTMASESFPSRICRQPARYKGFEAHIAQRQHSSIAKFPLPMPLIPVTNSDQELDIDDGRLKELDTKWKTLASLYSKAEVTNLTDRLVAFRGILNRWAQILEEPEADWCIAGLWKRCLAQQLLWIRDGQLDETDARLNARAKKAFEIFPSWSWASCVAGITYSDIMVGDRDPQTADIIQVESIQIDQPLTPETTYTAFETSSRIVLRGSVIDHVDSENLTARWAEDYADKKARNRWFSNMSFSDKRSHFYKTWFVFDRLKPEAFRHQDLRLLHLLARDRSESIIGLDGMIWESPGVVEGLLLESLGVRNGLPTYRRMGIYSQYYYWGSMSEVLGNAKGFIGAWEEIVAELREKRKEWPLLQLV